MNWPSLKALALNGLISVLINDIVFSSAVVSGGTRLTGLTRLSQLIVGMNTIGCGYGYAEGGARITPKSSFQRKLESSAFGHDARRPGD
jgi:hypothetical protein